MTVKIKMRKKKPVVDYKALYEGEKRQSEYYNKRWNETAVQLKEAEKRAESAERKVFDAEDRARNASEALQKMKYDVIRWLINPECVPKDDSTDFGGLFVRGPRVGR